jgi:hypothetical protein|nr:MAG TPA: hypothetical protein [Caudoviricetes sp.]DAY21441.1 MAG TPA: hypothetical protein [Caudoviricetes sp.]
MQRPLIEKIRKKNQLMRTRNPSLTKMKEKKKRKLTLMRSLMKRKSKILQQMRTTQRMTRTRTRSPLLQKIKKQMNNLTYLKMLLKHKTNLKTPLELRRMDKKSLLDRLRNLRTFKSNQ